MQAQHEPTLRGAGLLDRSALPVGGDDAAARKGLPTDVSQVRTSPHLAGRAALTEFPETISRYEDARLLNAFIEEHVPRSARTKPTAIMNMLGVWISSQAEAERDGDEQLREQWERQLFHAYPYALAEVRRYFNDPHTLTDAAQAPQSITGTMVGHATCAGTASNLKSTTRPAEDVIWLVPNRAWLPELHASEPSAAVHFQPLPIRRRIDDGFEGITLAALFEDEYRVGDYPPDLCEFSVAMLRLVYEERQHLCGRGDRLRWQQADADVQARYPDALRRALELFRSVEPKSHPTFQNALSRVAANDHARHFSGGSAGDVAIEWIKVDAVRRGQANVDNVAALAQSIKDGGLINPITITPTGELVGGLHRLLACEQIGMTAVPVFVRDLVGQKKRLAEIDENLVRRQLPALELAELTLERQQIYEALHPETKQYKRGGHAKAARSATALSAVADTFTTDTAKKTRVADRTIRQYAQVAKMPSSVKEAVRHTPVASRINELVALARLSEVEQTIVAKIIAEGRATGVSAARELAALKATSVPYPLAQAKTMAAQLAMLRRVRARVSETLDEWQGMGHPEMVKYREYWRGMIATLDEALFKTPALPEPCPCNGAPDCSGCAGQGWVPSATPA